MSEEERIQLENELLMTCSKSQAINKYIDELEESSKLSELWCKSQEDKKKLQQRIDKAIEYIGYERIISNMNNPSVFGEYERELLKRLEGNSNDK